MWSRIRKAARLQGEHCSTSLSAGLWVPGYGQLLIRPMDENTDFSKVTCSLTVPGLQRTWSTCPVSAASSAVPEAGAGLRSQLHPAKSPTPQQCAHICPLQQVCSAALIHGSIALEKDTAACLLLKQHFGQIQVLVRCAMGSLDKEVEGSSSPGQRACLWLGRSSACEAGSDV